MNDYNNAMSQAGHRLELIGRERLTVSGVEDVERFDETGIIMSTSVGTLVITGEDLHIGKLSLDGASSMWTAGSIPSPMRTAVRSGGAFSTGCSGEAPWPLLSPSRSCSSVRRSCWAWLRRCCMTCCGPSACGCPA